MCTSGYISNEMKPSAKFHFLLNECGVKKQWIRFNNKREWPATKHSMLCELYFEEKYLQRCEKCTLEWLMNPVLTVYHQKHLSKHLLYQHIKLFGVFPERRSFPDEFSAFQQRACFQFNELDNCVLNFHLVFDDEAKIAKILKSIRVNADLRVQLQYNGLPLPLSQWFVEGHLFIYLFSLYLTLTKYRKQKNTCLQ